MSGVELASQMDPESLLDVSLKKAVKRGESSVEPQTDSLTEARSTNANATITATVGTGTVDQESPQEASRRDAPEGWTEAMDSLPKLNGFTDAEKQKITRKNKNYVPPPDAGTGDTAANGIVIGVVSAASKVLIRGLNKLYTYRLNVLTDHIEHRPPDTGLLTVANHRSVVDDPIMLAAMLPRRIILRPGLMRWGLCSADICFQNPAIGRFMTLGKALPIVRGEGIGHSTVLAAASKLAHGDWLHVYPEGRVVQRGMGYMKHGVGKMLAIAHERVAAARQGFALAGESASGLAQGVPQIPIVLPMYHEGAENVMPQHDDTHELIGRFPKTGNNLYAIVGDPIDFRDLFENLMPACSRAGGTKSDPEECIALYDAISDRLGMSVRLLRAELRMRVRAEHGVFLGDPYEVS